MQQLEGWLRMKKKRIANASNGMLNRGEQRNLWSTPLVAITSN